MHLTPPSVAEQDYRATPRTARMIVAVLCFGGLSVALMQTLVIPIQAELPHLLNTSASNAAWVLTATLLAAAAAMPVAGRLGDIVGKQRVLVGSAVLLTLGSLIAALSDSVLPLLVGRGLQGLAMGYIPVAISLVREVTPPAMTTTAIAALSATMGVGGAIGLPLSAWIAEGQDWHWLFGISTALGVLVLLASIFLIPHVRDAHPAHLDVVGAFGLALGLSLTLVGVSKGNDWGWSSYTTWGSIVGGVVVLLVWGWYEVGHDDPLVDLRTTARAPVLLTNLAALLVGFGMMASTIVVPQLLEMPTATGYGLGQTILQAGLWMAPGGLMMMAMAPVSSRLMRSIGAKLTLVIGAVVIGCAYLVALFLMDEPWQLMLAIMLSSAGVGIGYAAMPTLILDNVPMEEAGSSVGLNGLMRSVGTTIAGALMALLMTRQTMTLGEYAVPTRHAFQMCLIAGAVAAFAGALIAMAIPGRQRPEAAEVEQTEVAGVPAG